MTPTARTPANAPGPFYVAANECISCGAPEAEAPGLIRFDEAHQSCYFYRQPVGPDETYRALSAMAVCCVGALRYADSETDILRRLARLQLTAQCDTPTRPSRSVPLTIVTFADRLHDAVGDETLVLVANKVAKALATVAPHVQVSSPTLQPKTLQASFGYTTAAKVGDGITVGRANDGTGRWLIVVTPHGPSFLGFAGALIDDALRSLPEISDRRWYSPAAWAGSRQWESFPL